MKENNKKVYMITIFLKGSESHFEFDVRMTSEEYLELSESMRDAKASNLYGTFWFKDILGCDYNFDINEVSCFTFKQV